LYYNYLVTHPNTNTALIKKVLVLLTFITFD